MSEIEKLSSDSKLYKWRETINLIIDKLTSICENYFSLSEKNNDYHNIGDIWITFDDTVEFDGREFNGDILSRKLYHNLYEYISSKPSLCISEELYKEKLKTDGYCNFYTLGSDNKTFRLPYIKNDNYKIGVRTFGAEKENTQIIGRVLFSINDNYLPENAIYLNGQTVKINDYYELYTCAQNNGNLVTSIDTRYTSINAGKNNPFYIDNNDGTFTLPKLTVDSYFEHCIPYTFYKGIADTSKNNVGDFYFIFNNNENIPSYVKILNGQDIDISSHSELFNYINDQSKSITRDRNTEKEPNYTIDVINSKITLPKIVIQDDIIVGVVVDGTNPTEEHVSWMDLIHTADSEFNKNRYTSDPDFGMRTQTNHDSITGLDTYDIHIQQYKRPNDYRFLRADNIWSDDYVSKSRDTETTANLSIGGNLVVTGNITGANVYNSIWNEEEPYGDIAEYFQRGCKTEKGDIIAIDTEADSESYIKAKLGMKYYGVHSESYRYIMGGDMSSSNPKELNRRKYIPVALIGRVPVKIIGKVNRGDYIQLSNTEGVGIVAQQWNENVFGVACESSNDVREKLVLVRLYK